MDSSELERLQLEILGDLCQLPRESLVELCDFLTIAGPNLKYVTGKNRMSLVTMIKNHLHREELEELEDKGISDLLSLKDKILELHAESEVRTMESVGQLDMLPSSDPQNVEQSEQPSEQSKLLKQLEEMQFQLASIPRQTAMERTNKALPRKHNITEIPQNQAPPHSCKH